ncbi:MAG: hydrogenase maturation factor [Candidatus Galacturonibacter soehngenii]|nr:hydrogenase maturation factor [Candidatus Galacturonibacter soehngenii]
MKIGKVSESVLKRSIFKQIRTKREEVVLGAGVGEDCAAIKLAADETFVISTDPITGTVKDIGSLSVHVTANDLASAGAEPVGILLTVLLPEDVFESDLKEMMQQVEEACEKLHIQVVGGHTEITKAVNQPIISVTGVGKVKDGKMISTGGAKPGQDIVVSKWIGLEGTSILAKEHETALIKKYPRTLVETAKGFDQYISVVKEAAEAVKSGVSAMHDVTEGGIYGALWEMAEASGVGLEIDLKKIPIRQETVEVCEFFHINPYGLISSGSMLMAIDNGYDLVRNLEKAGISAAVVGKATKSKDRVILNEEEKRFLEPPKGDELYNIKCE